MTAATRPSAARIVATMLVCLAISAGAVVAGVWQYGRYEERAAAAAGQQAAEGRAPQPLDDLVPPGSTALPPDAQWRTAVATGTWEEGSLRTLRNRPVDGTAAWQYLAWFTTDSGRSLLVNLGWIPQPGPLADPYVPELSQVGTVTIDVVLREWEPDDGKEPGDSVTRIAPEQLAPPDGEPVPGYGMLRDMCTAQGCDDAWGGTPVPIPVLSTGPHLSYAWQWWIFALMAPVGGVLLLRRDAAPSQQRAHAPTRSRAKGPTDEEIEDAL